MKPETPEPNDIQSLEYVRHSCSENIAEKNKVIKWVKDFNSM